MSGPEFSRWVGTGLTEPSLVYCRNKRDLRKICSNAEVLELWRLDLRRFEYCFVKLLISTKKQAARSHPTLIASTIHHFQLNFKGGSQDMGIPSPKQHKAIEK